MRLKSVWLYKSQIFRNIALNADGLNVSSVDLCAQALDRFCEFCQRGTTAVSPSQQWRSEGGFCGVQLPEIPEF
jgi:hypothetical protein